MIKRTQLIKNGIFLIFTLISMFIFTSCSDEYQGTAKINYCLEFNKDANSSKQPDFELEGQRLTINYIEGPQNVTITSAELDFTNSGASLNKTSSDLGCPSPNYEHAGLKFKSGQVLTVNYLGFNQGMIVGTDFDLNLQTTSDTLADLVNGSTLRLYFSDGTTRECELVKFNNILTAVYATW